MVLKALKRFAIGWRESVVLLYPLSFIMLGLRSRILVEKVSM